ncbi:MAG TPA: BON domain-containing protein [Rhizobiaceae bacterium]|nr:BON domain-containing protein [Rhizobiaceae bacterium]
MKKCATPVGLSRAVLAATIALGLSSAVYAADPEATTSRTAPDLAEVSETKAADNSARNARDAAGNEVTPLDQSHAESDVELTRAIRKMLVDDATLGTNAQNVKVVTVDGKVTLRGPVASAAEQARIVSIAEKAAGPDRVLNELEVIKR